MTEWKRTNPTSSSSQSSIAALADGRLTRCQVQLSQRSNGSTALTRWYTLTRQYVGIQQNPRGAREHAHCDRWIQETSSSSGMHLVKMPYVMIRNIQNMLPDFTLTIYKFIIYSIYTVLLTQAWLVLY